jgi:hypothetical protein
MCANSDATYPEPITTSRSGSRCSRMIVSEVCTGIIESFTSASLSPTMSGNTGRLPAARTSESAVTSVPSASRSVFADTSVAGWS